MILLQTVKSPNSILFTEQKRGFQARGRLVKQLRAFLELQCHCMWTNEWVSAPNQSATRVPSSHLPLGLTVFLRGYYCMALRTSISVPVAMEEVIVAGQSLLCTECWRGSSARLLMRQVSFHWGILQTFS